MASCCLHAADSLRCCRCCCCWCVGALHNAALREKRTHIWPNWEKVLSGLLCIELSFWIPALSRARVAAVISSRQDCDWTPHPIIYLHHVMRLFLIWTKPDFTHSLLKHSLKHKKGVSECCFDIYLSQVMSDLWMNSAKAAVIFALRGCSQSVFIIHSYINI